MKNNNQIIWQSFRVTNSDRKNILKQNPIVLWFTGLPGSGKTTLSDKFQTKLIQEGFYSYILDGDNLRHGLCSDLGFSEQDRAENIRRAAQTAKLLLNIGIIVICAFASPFIKDRNKARNIIGETFNEVYIKCDLKICEQRDPKGMYKKARNKEIKNFTGISSRFEPPKNPELIIETNKINIEASTDKIYRTFIEKIKNYKAF